MVTGAGAFFGHRRLPIVGRCPKKTPAPFRPLGELAVAEADIYNQPSENVDLASQRPDD